MECREAEDLLEAYGASADAYALAVDILVKVLNGSRAEFWSAHCNKNLKAIYLHVIKHECQPTWWPTEFPASAAAYFQMSSMVCEDKIRLITAYADATERYAAAAAKLRVTTGTELGEARAASEAARAECAGARRALHEHKAEHGCS